MGKFDNIPQGIRPDENDIKGSSDGMLGSGDLYNAGMIVADYLEFFLKAELEKIDDMRADLKDAMRRTLTTDEYQRERAINYNLQHPGNEPVDPNVVAQAFSETYPEDLKQRFDKNAQKIREMAESDDINIDVLKSLLWEQAQMLYDKESRSYKALKRRLGQ